MMVRRSGWIMIAVVAVGFAAISSNRCMAFGPCGDLPCVDLEWRPPSQTVGVGDIVELGLYAVSDSAFDHVISSLTVILSWEPQYLRLLDRDNNGPYDWLFSGFPHDSGLDSDHLNDTWTDGDAFLAALGDVAPDPLPIATTEGLLVTTILFRALAVTPSTQVYILPDVGGMSASQVFDGITPSTLVTGDLGKATVKIVPEPATLTLLLLGAALACRTRRR